MAEAAPNPNTEPFGVTPDYVQYDMNFTGTEQRAEQYDSPGTVIDWEAHPDTWTGDPEVAARRSAIITDERNNAYFLQGNRLYDVGRSRAKKSLVFVELDEHDSLPEIEIDGPPPMFTGKKKVTSVVIATPSARAGIDDYEGGGPDPFSTIRSLLERLHEEPEAPTHTGSRIRRSLNGLYGAEQAWDHHPRVAGRKTQVTKNIAEEFGKIPEEEAVNPETGILISPPQGTEEGEYERVFDEWGRRRRELGRTAMHRMSFLPGIRFVAEIFDERARQRQQEWKINTGRKRPLPRKRLL